MSKPSDTDVAPLDQESARGIRRKLVSHALQTGELFPDVFGACSKKLEYDGATVQARAHLLAVDGETPSRAAQARQLSP